MLGSNWLSHGLDRISSEKLNQDLSILPFENSLAVTGSGQGNSEYLASSMGGHIAIEHRMKDLFRQKRFEKGLLEVQHKARSFAHEIASRCQL